MTRYGIDVGVALRLIREGITVPDEHQLVGPTLLRSHALSLIYASFRGGEISDKEARTLLDGLATLRIRLLGDRVSRAVAFRIADQLGWPDTADAEYVAVAQLQADAFVTLDERLAGEVAGVVTVVPFEVLAARPG